MYSVLWFCNLDILQITFLELCFPELRSKLTASAVSPLLLRLGHVSVKIRIIALVSQTAHEDSKCLIEMYDLFIYVFLNYWQHFSKFAIYGNVLYGGHKQTKLDDFQKMPWRLRKDKVLHGSFISSSFCFVLFVICEAVHL